MRAAEIWFLMHHSVDPRRLSLALTCYCDDSGTHAESPVAVVGGVVMSKPRFIEMDALWKKMLHVFRIDKIHMQDFVRPNGRYCTMRKEMKVALFTEVAKLLNRHKTYSISVGTPKSEFYSQLSQDVAKELMGPYALAFLTVTLANREAARLRHYNNRIAYLIDFDSQREQLRAAHDKVVEIERSRDEHFTGAMASDTDDNVIALQAADVIAWTYHRKNVSRSFGEDFKPLLKTIAEYQLSPAGKRTQPHLSLSVRAYALEALAVPINNWIRGNGKIPTWDDLGKYGR
jgi:hypothetical protein